MRAVIQQVSTASERNPLKQEPMLWNRQDSYLHPGTGFFCNDDVRMGIKKVLKPLSKPRFFRNMKDAVDLYNTMTVLFFQFSCRSNYTLAILLPFISCQTHPAEKTCRAVRFIFYPVLRVTVRIDMDQYHFIFFAEFHFPADTMLSELVYSIIPFFHTGGCYGNE